jgi:hypothetical protein
MYIDSSPVRRSSETRRLRGACRKPARQATPSVRSQPVSATARRSRMDDAIVAQWLLDQVPSGHRHTRHELAV